MKSTCSEVQKQYPALCPQEQMLEKIGHVRAMMGDRDVEVDGGIDAQTAMDAVEAGANVLVAGSYIFNHTSYAEAIESLRDPVS